MKASIVILNWNGAKLMKEYLPSVAKIGRERGYEVAVADNCSSDRSIELLEKEFSDLRIIRLDRNYGFAEGYNKALAQIDAQYYVLCNSDILLKSDAVTPLLEMMDQNPKIAIAAPKIKSLTNPEMFEYAGAAGGYIDRYGYPFCRGRIMGTVEKDEGQYNDQREIFWASGAFMAVRASAWQKLGGLDGNFFAHMEEIDLCWRAQNRGYKIAYCPQSEVYHLGGGTLESGNPRKIFLNFRNSLWMLMKNLPGKRLAATLFARMMMDGASAMVYLAQGKPKYFWAVARAHAAFYANIPRLWRMRKTCKSENMPGTVMDGSMVWRYTAKKQKTFNKLFN